MLKMAPPPHATRFPAPSSAAMEFLIPHSELPLSALLGLTPKEGAPHGTGLSIVGGPGIGGGNQIWTRPTTSLPRYHGGSMPKNYRLRLYGHRGASAHLPENTLPAFEKALADGANALEIDIHRTSDGHFVVAHDPGGERLAGVNEEICALCLDHVKRWDVSTTDARDLDHHCVPTLEEVLEAFPDTPLSIDHKPNDPVSVPALLELIARHGAEDRVTLASFSVDVVNRIRQLGYPGRTALTKSEIAWLRFLPTALARRMVVGNAAQIPTHSGPIRLDTRHFLEKCRALGIRADYWVVNDPDEAKALLDAGATGIITDDPALIAPVFRERET